MVTTDPTVSTGPSKRFELWDLFDPLCSLDFRTIFEEQGVCGGDGYYNILETPP